MERSRGLAVIGGIFLWGAMSVASAANESRVYYMDGIDTDNGMSAAIAPEHGFLRVAGDVFVLSGCGEPATTPCFSSGYMSFRAPLPSTRQWTEGEIRFAKAGRKRLKIGGDDVCVDVIASDQKFGRFEFYYHDRYGLIGWTLKSAMGSDVEAEVYLLDRLPNPD